MLRQFIKFTDTNGLTLLIHSDEITALGESSKSDECLLMTKHGNFLVKGDIDTFLSSFASYFGDAWDATPPLPSEDE